MCFLNVGGYYLRRVLNIGRKENRERNFLNEEVNMGYSLVVLGNRMSIEERGWLLIIRSRVILSSYI